VRDRGAAVVNWRARKPLRGRTIEPGLAPTEGIDISVEELQVIEWCPNLEGKDPTQVWMILRVKEDPTPIILRFKGPDTLDVIIQALTQHRINVFGEFRS
jgi:hypothetical protein